MSLNANVSQGPYQSLNHFMSIWTHQEACATHDGDKLSARTYTYVYALKKKQSHVTYARTHTYTYTFTCIFVHMRVQVYTLTYTYTRKHAHTHTVTTHTYTQIPLHPSTSKVGNSVLTCAQCSTACFDQANPSNRDLGIYC